MTIANQVVVAACVGAVAGVAFHLFQLAMWATSHAVRATIRACRRSR